MLISIKDYLGNKRECIFLGISGEKILGFDEEGNIHTAHVSNIEKDAKVLDPKRFFREEEKQLTEAILYEEKHKLLKNNKIIKEK